MTPRARTTDLELVEHHGDLLIRDQRSAAEHCLHPLAAYVWTHADGRTDIATLAAGAAASLNTNVTEDEVWAAVDVLTGAALLEARIAPPAATQRVGRRDLLRSLGTGSVAAAAIAAVAVASPGDAAGQSSAENAQKQSAENAQKQSAENAQKRFDRIEDRLERHAAEQDTKFEDRAAREDASKNAAESRAKSRDDFENVILEAYFGNVGDPFAPAQFVSRTGVVSLMGHVALLGVPPDPEIVPCVEPSPTADPPDPDAEADMRAARITTLPAHCRPARTLVFRTASSGPLGSHEIHITSAGGVFVIANAVVEQEVEGDETLEEAKQNVAKAKKIVKKKKTREDGSVEYDWPARLSLSGLTFPVSRATDILDDLAERDARAEARQAQEQAQKHQEQSQKVNDLQRRRAQEAEQKKAAEARAKRR